MDIRGYWRLLGCNRVCLGYWMLVGVVGGYY